MYQLLRRVGLGTLLSCVVITSSHAAQPKWDKWTRENSIAHESYWAVVKQPDSGHCYLHQAYDGNLQALEIFVKKGSGPALISPFFYGLEGSITYSVDGGIERRIKASSMQLNLSRALIPELKRGEFLKVTFKPRGQRQRSQLFNLTGFTAAYSKLDSTLCN